MKKDKMISSAKKVTAPLLVNQKQTGMSKSPTKKVGPKNKAITKGFHRSKGLSAKSLGY